MAGTGDKKWIAVQQNTFTNWCNSSLKGTGNKIEDLVTDLDDGVRLVVLLEQLSKKKVSSKCVASNCLCNCIRISTSQRKACLNLCNPRT